MDKDIKDNTENNEVNLERDLNATKEKKLADLISFILGMYKGLPANITTEITLGDDKGEVSTREFSPTEFVEFTQKLLNNILEGK